MNRKIGNILITGGAGFIGSAFIRHLFHAESTFTGTCVNLDLLTYAGNQHNLQCIESHPRYRFYRDTICNEKLVEHLCAEYDIQCILHFAAESHVDRSIMNPSTFLETNIFGTFHLLEVVRRHPHIHFHHVSTDEVYGALGEEGSFNENSPYKPSSPYSASKASSDHLVRAYARTYGLSTCISHCSNNYGPYQFPEKLIPLIILNCIQKKPLPVYGTGSQIRDWIYVQDHVEALHLLLEKGKSGETYSISAQNEKSNLAIVREIISCVATLQKEDLEHYDSLITFVKDRPGHDFRYALDSSKLKVELNWHPRFPLIEGLKKTVSWYFNEFSSAVIS